jgi:uncharacterized cupredoxin-like copper-binding protein
MIPDLNPRRWNVKKIAAAIIVLVALSGAACAAQAAAKPNTAKKPAPATVTLPNSVTVGEGDMFLTPSATTVAAGQVSFTVSNAGPSPHEFVIVKGDPTGTTGDEAGRVSEEGHVGGPEGPEIGNINSGHTKSLTVDLPPGTYTIMCNLPGHYVAGMHSTIVVR